MKAQTGCHFQVVENTGSRSERFGAAVCVPGKSCSGDKAVWTQLLVPARGGNRRARRLTLAQLCSNWSQVLRWLNTSEICLICHLGRADFDRFPRSNPRSIRPDNMI